MRRRAFSVALGAFATSAVLCVLPGCGLSALLGVVAATSLTGKGSQTPPVPTPVSVLTPSTTVFDRVSVNYTLSGSTGTTFDVSVEYSTNGAAGPFTPATEALGAPSQGTLALSASPAGNPHVFVWSSFADLDALGITNSPTVVLRVTALQRSTTGGASAPFGQKATTTSFALDNRLIATVAGPPTAEGEGVPATDVPLNSPQAAAVDSGGNILVADTAGARVRRVDSVTDLVTTFAGSGTAGFAGDGGPAIAAQLLQPRGIALDAAGDAFVCDSANDAVRRIDARTGIITTVAGAAANPGAKLDGPTGIVVLGDGTVVFADTGHHLVVALDPSGTVHAVAGTGTAGTGGDGGAATGAQLSSPLGLGLDATGAILVADSGNHAVRRFTIGGTLETVAGTLGRPGLGAESVTALASALRSPAGVCAVGGAVYVSDTGNNRVRRFKVGAAITTVAGALDGTAGFAGDNGPAAAALLAQPSGLTPGAAGAVLVADTGNNRIRRIDAAGTILTVAGSGAPDAQNFGDGDSATNAQFKDPAQMALAPDGSIYVGDDLGHRVRRFAVDGTITTVAGVGVPGFSGDGGAAIQARLNTPYAVAVDRNGILFIGDDLNGRIRSVNGAGIITTVMGGGTGPDGVATLTSLLGTEALHSRRSADELLIADTIGHTVRRLSYQVDASGNVLNGMSDTLAGTQGMAGFAGDGGPATAALLNAPFDMDEDASGNILLLDQFAGVVRKFPIGGTITTIAGDPLVCGFRGDGGPATAAALCAFYMKFDPTTGFIYVTDFLNNRIRRFQDGGNIDTVAGDGQVGEAGVGGPATSANFPLPSGIVITADGSIIAAAEGTKRIYRFKPGGTVDVVAGREPTSPRGDGGPAVAASIFQPMVALGKDGTLYLAELNFGRIRSVDPRTGLISTLVGKGILGNKGFGGPLGDAFIDAVNGLAVDPATGDLAIGEINQSVIARISPSKNTIQKYVGSVVGQGSTGDGGPALQATLEFPEGVCFSPKSGALYFTDSLGGLVRRVDAQTTVISTVAGGGSDPTGEDVPALTAQLQQPAAVTVDAQENIYVANRAPVSTVRRFTVGGNIVTVAGVPGVSGFNGDGVPANRAQLNNPLGLAVDKDGLLYVSDALNNRVRRIDRAGFIATIAGTGESGSGPDGVPATLSKLSGPRQLALDGRGNIYVGEEFGNRVRRFRLFP